MATSIGSTQDTKSLLDKINEANATKTAKGTRIVKQGQDMDKNAFLRILSAELGNQDPTNAKDGTEYVAQMAQFAGLEQMANLNGSMRLSSANSLIGRVVTLNKLDDNGNMYSGLVKNVTKSGDDIKINVLVGQEKNSEGNLVDKYQEFSMDNVTDIEDLNYWLSSSSASASQLKSALTNLESKTTETGNTVSTNGEI